MARGKKSTSSKEDSAKQESTDSKQQQEQKQSSAASAKKETSAKEQEQKQEAQRQATQQQEDDNIPERIRSIRQQTTDQQTDTVTAKTLWGEEVDIPKQPDGPTFDTTTQTHLVYANSAWRRFSESTIRTILAVDQSSGLVLPEGSKLDGEKLVATRKK